MTRLARPVAVNWVKIYSAIYNDYVYSDYKNWEKFLKEVYDVNKATIYKIRKSNLIVHPETLEKLKKKLDIMWEFTLSL